MYGYTGIGNVREELTSKRNIDNALFGGVRNDDATESMKENQV